MPYKQCPGTHNRNYITRILNVKMSLQKFYKLYPINNVTERNSQQRFGLAEGGRKLTSEVLQDSNFRNEDAAIRTNGPIVR